MTEKRFEIKIGEFEEENIVDNLNKRTIREISYMCQKMNELNEENKELQERNNRQAKRLDDLYRLVEQKDWRALTDILDDFKKAEEQLQKEWKCYE